MPLCLGKETRANGDHQMGLVKATYRDKTIFGRRGVWKAWVYDYGRVTSVTKGGVTTYNTSLEVYDLGSRDYFDFVSVKVFNR